MESLFDVNLWIALVTLTVLEIVLGVDNIVFIAILVGKLPKQQQPRARQIGLGLAMFSRILLLLSLSWVIGLTAPLFTLFDHHVSGRDLILIIGGLFLLGKSTMEIHERLEGEQGHGSAAVAASFGSVLAQIVVLDLVFSLDSVITAVGMVNNIPIMIAAIMIAVGIMMFTSGAISDFIHRHPTIKMLALSFLLLIGMSLVAEGFSVHIPKGYIYFAMAFSVLVESLNIRSRTKKAAPVKLREPYSETEDADTHK